MLSWQTLQGKEHDQVPQLITSKSRLTRSCGLHKQPSHSASCSPNTVSMQHARISPGRIFTAEEENKAGVKGH